MGLFSIDGKCGWNFEAEDYGAADRESTPFLMAVGDNFTAPPEIDYESWLRIENQSSMGSCRGHSLSSGVEVCGYIATGGRVMQTSRLHAYIGAQSTDGLYGDRGSTMIGGVKFAKDHGLCPEADLPYPNPVRYPSWAKSRSSRAKVLAELEPKGNPYRIGYWTRIRTYDEWFAFLASGQGFVDIGIRWGVSVGSDGVATRWRPGRGGHAVGVGEYASQKDSRGRHYPWLRNSWGTRWGMRGRCKLPPSMFEDMLSHPYTVCVGYSEMPEAKPRDINWITQNPFAGLRA